jgi:hypothetical protein
MSQRTAEPQLPKFDRGLIVVAPHGDFIAGGVKTALIKSRRYQMEGEDLLVIQRKQALGTVRLAAPRIVSMATFRRARGRHLVSEDERRRWWPGKATFYMYDILEFHPLPAPVRVEYPRGIQVFAKASSIRVA